MFQFYYERVSGKRGKDQPPLQNYATQSDDSLMPAKKDAKPESETKKPKTSKKRNGRPTLYRDELAARAKERCLLGATNEDLAEALGVDIETIKRWIRDDVGKFRTSVYEGRDGADAVVASSLFKRANGYEHDAVHFSAYEGEVTATSYTKHYPPDTEAAKWWLKNRQPKKWRDLTRTEITGADGEPVQVAKVEWKIVEPGEKA